MRTIDLNKEVKFVKRVMQQPANGEVRVYKPTNPVKEPAESFTIAAAMLRKNMSAFHPAGDDAAKRYLYKMSYTAGKRRLTNEEAYRVILELKKVLA